uniref:Methyltransferase domain-containing protein n=1 Tax=Parascaris univalens TaxID=6257 RepID=A0A914ZKY1_PARUN
MGTAIIPSTNSSITLANVEGVESSRHIKFKWMIIYSFSHIF